MPISPIVWFLSFALAATVLLWLAGKPASLGTPKCSAGSNSGSKHSSSAGRSQDFPELLCLLPRRKWKGDGPVAPALKTKVPLLTTLAQRNHGTFPTARVRSIIAGDEIHAAHGSREMPVWGPVFHQIQNDQDLGYVRLQNVTEYLSSIQQK